MVTNLILETRKVNEEPEARDAKRAKSRPTGYAGDDRLSGQELWWGATLSGTQGCANVTELSAVAVANLMYGRVGPQLTIGGLTPRNKFSCDCRLVWMLHLENATRNDKLRRELRHVKCDFQASGNSSKVSRLSASQLGCPADYAKPEFRSAAAIAQPTTRKASARPPPTAAGKGNKEAADESGNRINDGASPDPDIDPDEKNKAGNDDDPQRTKNDIEVVLNQRKGADVLASSSRGQQQQHKGNGAASRRPTDAGWCLVGLLWSFMAATAMLTSRSSCAAVGHVTELTREDEGLGELVTSPVVTGQLVIEAELPPCSLGARGCHVTTQTKTRSLINTQDLTHTDRRLLSLRSGLPQARPFLLRTKASVLAMRKHLPCQRLDHLTPPGLEAIFVEVFCKHGKLLLVSTCCPPSLREQSYALLQESLQRVDPSRFSALFI
ncbi:hypothetical protein HPB47_014950 [Ixodes persulcatus]|uniref:Uncharacterized protein n=1 Tax=Ixodes persulcatus TaxID=34615 RepID=A0AC60QUR1_IXOPE|nr:hypothetical protein HPB47_014950 [Ixodes persulcatus]